MALVASGYNAGPGRPRRWISEFGDPRRAEVDVVDWVETIPFTETRTYVMRVAESRGDLPREAERRGGAGARLTGGSCKAGGCRPQPAAKAPAPGYF